MRNITDIIEQFILEILGAEDKLEISRNDLAAHFSCAPSQINYVLQTRFTPDRGFVIESRRGIGGSVTVARLSQTPSEAYGSFLGPDQNGGISFQRSCQILDRLLTDEIISEREAAVLKSVMADKTLTAPAAVKDNLRINILRAVLIEIIKD